VTLVLFLAIVLFVDVIDVDAAHRCVWVTGVLRCNKDEKKQMNVEVRVYDKDGFSVFQAIDPDDLMGVTFTESDGTFKLDGCGDDFDWFPGVPNLPEPYLQIRHYCNSEKGETIRLPEFSNFVPDTHDIGVLELDEVTASSGREPVELSNLPTDTARADSEQDANRSVKKAKVDDDGNVITRPDEIIHTE